MGILDLRRLPAKLHEPIKVVLILPIGALFTALVRTIIGIRTFGTFSPTLLALAFVYNDWKSGLCIFFVVIATGFVSRTLLDRLKLLLVPRLGIILTMVVMLMVLSISVMNYFNWVPNGQTVLLPMVILTNLVERFYVTSEEDSIFQAMRLLVTTVLYGPGNLPAAQFAEPRQSAVLLSRVALLHGRGLDPDGALHGLPPDGTGPFPRSGPPGKPKE